MSGLPHAVRRREKPLFRSQPNPAVHGVPRHRRQQDSGAIPPPQVRFHRGFCWMGSVLNAHSEKIISRQMEVLLGSDYGHQDLSEERQLVAAMRAREDVPPALTDKIFFDNPRLFYPLQ